MADKPSRGLVLYGDGLARFIDPSHTHLHSFASRAFCGLLSLPHSPPSESEDSRIVRELAELLDASEAYNVEDNTGVECAEKSLVPPVSERFMGMKAAIITNKSSMISFGGKLGFTMLQLNKLVENSLSLGEPSLDVLVLELLKLLGFQDGKVLVTSQFDLVFVHIGAVEKTHLKKEVEFFDGLVGKIMQNSKPGSEIGSRLHLSLVMSFGAVSEGDESEFSVLTTGHGDCSDLSCLIPCQSYTMKGGDLRKNVRHHCPMLVAQWQNGVTRQDMAASFTFEDHKKATTRFLGPFVSPVKLYQHGGNLVIPADRFLHEIAFKLWKAPKYGA